MKQDILLILDLIIISILVNGDVKFIVVCVLWGLLVILVFRIFSKWNKRVKTLGSEDGKYTWLPWKK